MGVDRSLPVCEGCFGRAALWLLGAKGVLTGTPLQRRLEWLRQRERERKAVRAVG